MLAIKFGPAIIGGLSALFGRKKQGPPQWYQQYLDDYKNNVLGGWDNLIAKGQQKDKVFRGLKQEALAAVGKGDYAANGFGPIGAQVLAGLSAKQAVGAKQSDRQTQMNFASAGINTGLLPQVLAQQATEREQGNELANADAMGKVALGAVTNFQSEKRARNEYLAQLQQGKSSSYNALLQAAAAGGRIQQPPSALSSILGGISTAAPGILKGLNPGAGGDEDIPTGVDSPLDFPSVPGGSTFPDTPGAASATPASMPTMASLNIPSLLTPATQASAMATAPTLSSSNVVPTNFEDWRKKYGGTPRSATRRI